jgi:hypothetical protein
MHLPVIGPASSKYFEGLLFILVRRPYDIGDGIHVSDINQDTAPMGSGWWLVEDVTLFTTTVMFMFTNERATLANGSLASSRIINATRSHHACVCNYIKLPLDVPYEKLQLFNEAIEQYVHNRPREWRALCSIRAIKIETAQGRWWKRRVSRCLSLRTNPLHILPMLTGFVEYSIVSKSKNSGSFAFHGRAGIENSRLLVIHPTGSRASRVLEELGRPAQQPGAARDVYDRALQEARDLVQEPACPGQPFFRKYTVERR